MSAFTSQNENGIAVITFDLPGEPVPNDAATFSRENAPRHPERVAGT